MLHTKPCSQKEAPKIKPLRTDLRRVVVVLPIILSEDKVFPFKFWFANTLQEGIHHQDELYCRLTTFSAGDRAKAYHLSCRLAQTGAIVILTLSTQRCGLWVSLRTPLARSVLSGNYQLVELPR
jgi:hypothetical protein